MYGHTSHPSCDGCVVFWQTVSTKKLHVTQVTCNAFLCIASAIFNHSCTAETPPPPPRTLQWGCGCIEKLHLLPRCSFISQRPSVRRQTHHLSLLLYRPWYLDGRFLLVVVTIGIILPLCLLKNLGYLGYTSGFSLTCMFFFLVVVIYNKFKISCTISNNGTSHTPYNTSVEDQCTPKFFTFNSKTAYALPTLAFAFVCHPSVLPIYSELRDLNSLAQRATVEYGGEESPNVSTKSLFAHRKKMQLVSKISFFAMFLMYLLTAIFGYLTFYDKVESELLGTYNDKKDILLLTVRLAVIIAVILTVPVLFFYWFKNVEVVKRSKMFILRVASFGSRPLYKVRSSLFELARKTKYKFWQHLLVTLVLLILIDLLVIFIPAMKDIFGAIGATSANMLIFILPSILYLKITHGNDTLSKERFWVSLLVNLMILSTECWKCLKGNDPKHTSRLCKGYLTKKEIDGVLRQMTWPPVTRPEPNQDGLGELDRRVKAKGPTSAKHLWELFQDCWKTVSSDYLLKLIKRMPRVCKAVIKANYSSGGYSEEPRI
ncbi:unnamed protein product [Ranitomeya imitator]|uniref:Amino acid transporter transmembrane domain-containing protein n=1 Tax=Ranitomeya imitator TaxID=111125 RepID=A0ABN9M0C0_9NEOB|nr:unnamed protein product [Ranitomeya imitator]